MLKHLIIFACVIASPLLADSHPAPGHWGITGEYLYMKPALDNTYYVLDSPQPFGAGFSGGKLKNNNFGYSSGYRVGLEYTFCECDRGLALYYTHLDANHNNTVTGSNLGAGLLEGSFYAGSASSDVNTKYQRIDALFAQGIYQCSCFNFRVLAGLEYVNLEAHQDLDYQANPVTVNFDFVKEKIKSSTWGIGPEIGFDCDFEPSQYFQCLPCGLNLNVFSTGSLLVGNAESSFISQFTLTTPGAFDYSSQESTRIVPAFHAGFSLDYDFCVCDRAFTIGLGYEFNSYIRALLVNSNPLLVLTDIAVYSDYAVQGLTASLSVNF